MKMVIMMNMRNTTNGGDVEDEYEGKKRLHTLNE